MEVPNIDSLCHFAQGLCRLNIAAGADVHKSAIVASHFSTTHLPARDQFEAYRAWASVLFDVENRRRPFSVGFDASSCAFYVGDIVVAVSNLDAHRYIRSGRRIRGDQIDHFLLTLYRSGGWSSDSRSGHTHGKAGQIGIIDLGQPLASDEPRHDETSMFVPRDLLEERLPELSNLHGRPVSSPYAGLLADYFNIVAGRLPTLLAQSGDELARASCDMLAACLRPSLDNVEIARPQIDAVLVRRAKRHIEREIKSADLSVDSLAICLGVSRRTLYRVFEPTGGIQKYILGKRLDMVRDELLDCNHRRKISEIAEEFGFARSDYFSRVFRNRFNQSPADLRAKITSREFHQTSGPESSNPSFAEWIRELGN